MPPQLDIKTPHTRINVALLLAVMGYIEAQPDEWKQEVWRDFSWTTTGNVVVLPNQCGTPMCFAGHVIREAGASWAVTKDDLKIAKRLDKEQGFKPEAPFSNLAKLHRSIDWVLAEEGDDPDHVSNDRVWDPEQQDYREVQLVEAGYRARRRLGLTEGEADDLFHGENNIWDIRFTVAKLIARAIEEYDSQDPDEDTDPRNQTQGARIYA